MLAPSSLGGGVGLVLLAALGLLAAAPAAAGGPISVYEACERQYGLGWVPDHNGDGKFDWFCYNIYDGSTAGVDLNAFCAAWYGGGSSARNDAGGVYDWYCT
jgi:hypothetical protein